MIPALAQFANAECDSTTTVTTVLAVAGWYTNRNASCVDPMSLPEPHSVNVSAESNDTDRSGFLLQCPWFAITLEDSGWEAVREAAEAEQLVLLEDKEIISLPTVAGHSHLDVPTRRSKRRLDEAERYLGFSSLHCCSLLLYYSMPSPPLPHR
jgi:hypothetical protein